MVEVASYQFGSHGPGLESLWKSALTIDADILNSNRRRPTLPGASVRRAIVPDHILGRHLTGCGTAPETLGR
jgi:hypothetical protein